MGKIYSGVVQSVTNYGAFIKIEGTSGLCHISQMSFDGSRVESTNVLAPNQKVFVKVINIQTHANRISLSMRGINQNTGHEEPIPQRGRHQERQPRPKRKLTSPERWEIRQLISSGAVSADDYPGWIRKKTHKQNQKKTDNLHIELNDKKPDFLKVSKSPRTFRNHPIPVNRLGPLTKSAQRGSKFARDFKEEKFKQKKQREKEEKCSRNCQIHYFKHQNR